MLVPFISAAAQRALARTTELSMCKTVDGTFLCPICFTLTAEGCVAAGEQVAPYLCWAREHSLEAGNGLRELVIT